jgi:hypothetical protein
VAGHIESAHRQARRKGRKPCWISAACSRSRAISCRACSTSAKRVCSMRMAATFAITVSRFKIVFGEFAREGRRIDINDADNLVARLQRDRHQSADILLDDAAALAESVVDRRIAHQNRDAAVEHAVANGGLMRKPSPCWRLHQVRRPSSRHQHAAVGLHGLNRKIEDEAEELGQRPVAGQFVAGADQRGDVRSRERLGFAAAAIGLDDAVEVGDDGRRLAVWSSVSLARSKTTTGCTALRTAPS